jgi:hypothetical protein
MKNNYKSELSGGVKDIRLPIRNKPPAVPAVTTMSKDKR